MIHKKTTDELVNERPSAIEIDSQPRTPISIVADNIRSLDNIGLLFRLCETARLEKLYLTGYTGHPEMPNDSRPRHVIARHQRRIEKTAVYALPHQPWDYHQNAVELVKSLKESGQTIIALEQTDKSIPYHKLPVTRDSLPVTLILGHERRGVQQELLELSDHIVEIPILGIGNSHNVSISAGILTYHLLSKAECI